MAQRLWNWEFYSREDLLNRRNRRGAKRPIGFLVVIVVQTETDGADGGVHNDACSAREIDFSQFLFRDGFLL